MIELALQNDAETNARAYSCFTHKLTYEISATDSTKKIALALSVCREIRRI